MPAATWLDWTERDALAERLDALAENFGARRDFDVWRSGVLGAFIGGGIAFVGTPEGGWLLQGGEGYWGVMATIGSLSDTDQRRIFRAVKAEARLVVWDEEVGEGWAETLGVLGACRFVRQSYLQDLAYVELGAVPGDGIPSGGFAIPSGGFAIALVPYSDFPGHAAALELLAAANAEGLEGMFLTLPAPPTLENCRRALAGVMAGQHGPVLPWASFVAVAEGRVVGTLLCVQGEHGQQGMLFDLYVDPAARGRQLSRRLVAAMQGALLARGYRENRFMTMGANAPVHRLFRESEIVACEETRGGYWARA